MQASDRGLYQARALSYDGVEVDILPQSKVETRPDRSEIPSDGTDTVNVTLPDRFLRFDVRVEDAGGASYCSACWSR